MAAKLDPTLQGKCDKVAKDLLDSLPAIQEQYLADKGRYWQGLRTPTAIPADGAAEAPEKDVKPTNQAEDWADVGASLPATQECSTTVNIYDGPGGQGYEVVSEVIEKGIRWQKKVNVGPETWRAHDWLAQAT